MGLEKKYMTYFLNMNFKILFFMSIIIYIIYEYAIHVLLTLWCFILKILKKWEDNKDWFDINIVGYELQWYVNS